MAESLAVEEGLWTRTLLQLRSCGQGRRECVAYWTGPLDRPGLVDDLLHPRHSSSRGGYELAPEWLAEVWGRLAAERRSIRVQVHTHPRTAFHSRVDDEFPIVASEGFLSLVLPRFAADPQTLSDAYLARIGKRGGFEPVPVASALEISR